MIIFLHVVIALLGIVSATYGYFRPTNTNLRISYSLVAATFASGFYLVWREPATILHMCLTGIFYLSVVSVGIVLSRRKLLTLQSEQIENI